MKFSIGEAFNGAFKVYRRKFFVIFSLSFFAGILVFVIYAITAHYVLGDFAKKLFSMVGLARSGYYSPIDLANFITRDLIMPNLTRLFLWFAITSVVSLIVYLFINNAFLSAFKEAGIKFKNYCPSFKKIFNYLLGRVLLSVLSSALLMLPYFLIFGSTLVLVKILGFLGIVAIRLVLLIYNIFYAQEILAGNSILQSFKNSSKLIFGNFWKLILLIFLTDVAIMSVAIIVAIIAAILSAIILLLFRQYMFVRPFVYYLLIGTVYLTAVLIVLLAIIFEYLVLIHAYTQVSLPKSNTQEVGAY